MIHIQSWVKYSAVPLLLLAFVFFSNCVLKRTNYLTLNISLCRLDQQTLRIPAAVREAVLVKRTVTTPTSGPSVPCTTHAIMRYSLVTNTVKRVSHQNKITFMNV